VSAPIETEESGDRDPARVLSFLSRKGHHTYCGMLEGQIQRTTARVFAGVHIKLQILIDDLFSSG
jgi:hypothetical protein